MLVVFVSSKTVPDYFEYTFFLSLKQIFIKKEKLWEILIGAATSGTVKWTVVE